MNVKLTRITGNPVLAIEEAASNCYDSEPSSDGSIMNSCYGSGHTSVLEFVTFTFHLEGISRACLAQLTRHRHAGYAVRSQRYCNEDNFQYVVPPSIKSDSFIQAVYDGTMETLRNTYNRLISLGVKEEDARYILPNACGTKVEMTINLRSLINFMNERLCSRAQWEIRELAEKMKDEIVARCSQFEPFLVPKCEKHKGHPFCTEHKSCGRHPKLQEVYQNKQEIKEKRSGKSS